MKLRLVLLAAALWAAGASLALAQDDDGSLHLMNEPSEYTDVIDAFDGDDPFDSNVRVDFLRSATTGTIQRERNDPGAGDGRSSVNFLDIADYEHVRYGLTFGVDVGIYHDLAAFVRLPFVLSDAQRLDPASGRTEADVNANLADPEGSHVFEVPFESPERSGLDYLGAGLSWAIFNQHRSPGYPTWLVSLEGRFGIGEPMHACQKGAAACLGGGDDAGLTRGTNALHLETRASRRMRYIEPYTGLSFLIEWPGASDGQFLPAGDSRGHHELDPADPGRAHRGHDGHPGEHRGRWQRFGIDLRVVGTYVSEGHDYSPLFDALGTSQSRYITEPGNEHSDGTGRQVPFYGLTDTQSHGRLGARVGLEMQAARYIRFAFGAGLYYDTPYFVTFADACNPNVSPTSDMDPRQGNCRTGIINPDYRAAIDLAGRRFRMDGDVTLDFYANATGQF